METQPKPRTNAKEFFINLGAIVSLYTVIFSLINLLFTVIDKAYPKIINGYDYLGSQSISWPVATLIIFFPIFIVLMWLLAKEYVLFPEKQNAGIHKWLAYITLFISGLAIAGDLITVLYYFIDGQELTAGFLLKVLVLLILATGIFTYYLSDVRGKLTSKTRKIYRIISLVIVLGSIVWGFAILGSPRTQQLLKYDQQKINDLQNINNQVTNFYGNKGTLPKTLEEVSGQYYAVTIDAQSGKPYEYQKTGETTYNLCAEFNKAIDKNTAGQTMYAYPSYDGLIWTHPVGRYCFAETINPNIYSKPVPFPVPVR